MSLEDAIKANTAAITEQTAFLKTLQGKAGAAVAAPAGKPAGKPSGKPKKITLDTIKERFGAYLGIEDKKERKARIENVQAFAAHFEVEKMSELEESQWEDAIAALDTLEAGDKPDFMEEGGGSDDSLV